MGFLVDIFFSVPFLFWNLIWLSEFHLGLWIFLYFRMKGSRRHGLAISEIGFDLPTVAVVLPLLRLGRQEIDCLRSLLTQDHPNYQLWISLDAAAPPDQLNRAELRAILAEHPAIAVHCSPCLPSATLNPAASSDHAFSQAIQACCRSSTPPEVLALVSPQLTPRPTWLRELTAPLSHQGMTATTSYPWHEPPLRLAALSSGALFRSGLTPLVQYTWNAIAAMQMIAVSKILWHGSMAVKTSYLTQPYVLDRWKLMGQTDVALGQLLHQESQPIRFVATLMNLRRSPLPPAQFGQEIRQRLVALHRHHQLGWILAAQGIFVSLTNLRFFGKMLWSGLIGDLWTLGWLSAGFSVYLMVLILLITTTERFVATAADPNRLGDPAELGTAKGDRHPARPKPSGPSRRLGATLGLIFFLPLSHLAQALMTVWTLFESQARLRPSTDPSKQRPSPSTPRITKQET